MTIDQIITELKTRRDWKSVEEVEAWFEKQLRYFYKKGFIEGSDKLRKEKGNL